MKFFYYNLIKNSLSFFIEFFSSQNIQMTPHQNLIFCNFKLKIHWLFKIFS